MEQIINEIIYFIQSVPIWLWIVILWVILNVLLIGSIAGERAAPSNITFFNYAEKINSANKKFIKTQKALTIPFLMMNAGLGALVGQYLFGWWVLESWQQLIALGLIVAGVLVVLLIKKI